ncbi:hypothetical protein JW926_04740 [Candidatus Sumerlaeota bacterium]|nr:hypothetical protein [Candidatus Sumerlaeota bacterium]
MKHDKPLIMKRIAPCAAFILTALFLYAPVLKKGAFLYGLDTIFHDYIMLLFGWGRLRQGDLALWMPYLYSGIPFVGSFSFCPFYPPSWLFLIPAFPLIFNLQYILHDILAGAFMYRLLRGFRMNRFESIFGGLGFQISGHLVTLCYPGHLQKFQAIVWLPLAWHFLHKTFSTGKKKYVLFASGALAMPLLSSHPQVYYYSIGVLFLYTLWLLGNRRREPLGAPPAKILSLFFLAVFFSLSLSAVQILPAFETSQYSVRSGGMTFQDAVKSSYPPSELWELILPRYTGDSVRGGYGHYWGKWGERLVSDYMGMAIFILGIIGAVFSKRLIKFFFSLIILLSILVACGVYSPFYRALFEIVPGMNRFRSPATIMFLIGFSSCALAAFGMELLLKDKIKLGGEIDAPKMIRIFLVVFAFLLIITFFVHTYYVRATAKLIEYETNRPVSVPFYSRLSLISLSLRRSAFFAAIVFGSLSLIFWADFNRRSGKLPPFAAPVTRAIFLVLVVFDAGLNDRAFIQPEPVEAFHNYLYNSPPDFRIKSQPQPVRLLEIGNELSNKRLLNGIGVPLGYHPIESRDYIAAWNAARPGSLAASRLTACPYILNSANAEANPQWKIIEHYSGLNKILYKWKSPVPFAYVPEVMESVLTQTRLLDKMSRNDFDPHKTSFTLSSEIFAWRRTASPDAFRISVREYRTDLVLLDVELPEEAYIVTGDVFMPGWKARLEDDSELPVFAANNAFRCFKAPSGKHAITIYYQPLSFTYGVIISMIALAIWMGMLFYFRKNREGNGVKQNCA